MKIMFNISKRYPLHLFFLIFTILFFSSTAIAQTFNCSTFTDPVTITGLSNKPATTTFDQMMGVNVKLWEVPPSPFSDIGSFIRTFHLTDGNNNRDFKNLTPINFSPYACSDPIPLPLTGAGCFACGTGYMTDIRAKYCEWKRTGATSKIIASIEKLGPFPDKHYSYADWGGTDQAVFNNARNYGKEFSKNYCTIGSGNACLTDVVELSNEAWGIPGVPGIRAFYRGFIVGVNDYYTSTNPTVTYNDVSFSFPATMNMAAWRIKLSAGAFQAYQSTPVWTNDYIATLVPSDCWAYLDGASVHPYAFLMNKGATICSTDTSKINGYTTSLTRHPEARNGQFLTLLNFVNWRNVNQPSKKVKVTEYGYDSQNVGDKAQGIYLVRSLLMMGRLDVNEAVNYELFDVVANGTGLYETSGLFTTTSVQKPSFHALKRFKSKLAGKVFLKKLNNNEYDNDNMFAYIVGNTDGTPTHLAVWRPININNVADPSTLTATLTIPNFPSQFSISPTATVVRLGTETTDVTFAYSTIQSGSNIIVGPIPYLIPIIAGTCKYDNAGNLTGCVCANNVTNAGTISGDQTSCEAYNPTNITSTTAASGGTGTLVYSWESSSTSASTGFSVISGATLATYDPPSNITQTTWYKRGARRQQCTIPLYSNVVTKTVSNVYNAGAIEGNETQCASYNPAIITSSIAASGGLGAITYQWQSSTTSATSGFTNISGATGATYDPATITVSTWYKRGARTGTCTFKYSNVVSKLIGGSCCPVTETFVRSSLVSNCRTYTLHVTASANATNVVYTLDNLPGNGYDVAGSSWTSGTNFTFTAPSYVTTASWTLPSVTAGSQYTLILKYCWANTYTCPTFSITTNGCNRVNMSADCSLALANPDENPAVVTENTDLNSTSDILQVFPNPAASNITLAIDGYTEENVLVEITNEVGQVVLTKRANFIKGRTDLDIHQLKDGIYFVKVNSKNSAIKSSNFVVVRD